jgi:hypothetical protein
LALLSVELCALSLALVLFSLLWLLLDAGAATLGLLLWVLSLALALLSLLWPLLDAGAAALGLLLLSVELWVLSLALALLSLLDWLELDALALSPEVTFGAGALALLSVVLELLLVGLLPPCPLPLPPSPSPPPMCCSLLVDGLSWRGATAEALV